ncbi:MAG: flagellar hook assembly protein FlgD [Nitrosomonas sp.]|uniref:flagellar hook assembly protein FlgD n=1 Tax=Nitrosomonas sp. TaxID=42353 RepID=UPI0027331BAC|nr:flagellar hook assembly protein FlgD [Nitrosomonas sp.]MDP1933713.1 flagellar hook assembly protein FlgD [Nitrosomonas sp.]MDP3664991.1 flagellar hook assembly protein FlgD [Nitrosomonas sp.]MDZ4107308.1 flagellar hook assembly protein FlgD [Nitrosomonas sp.]
MNSVQSTNSQTVSSITTTGITAKKEAENTQDRFLKLLVTQMKNQDPLKPLDNAEVTSQLAQISTVSGIDKLNTTLKLLSSDYEDSQSIEATAMIGRDAFVPGRSIQLEKNAAIAGIELAQPVDELKVTISDSHGVAIRNIDLKAYPAGISTIGWDGETDSGAKAADGEYTFEVSATQGGKDIKVNTLALGSVNSISHGEQGTLLDMGKLGLVSLSDIKQVF